VSGNENTPQTTLSTKTIVYFSLLLAGTVTQTIGWILYNEVLMLYSWLFLLIIGFFGIVIYGALTTYFFLRRYQLKHLVIGIGILIYLLILAILGQNGGLVHLGVIFAITIVWELASIIYVIKLRKGEIHGLNTTFDIPILWRTILGFAVLGLVLHTIGIISFNFMLSPLVLFALPGSILSTPFIGMCPPQPTYFDYGPIQFCKGLLTVAMGTIVWSLIGVIVGGIHARTAKP